MKFQQLKVHNFGSIKELDIPLADRGLQLILGRNEDAPKSCSNGSGKSTLLDSFTWVVWGQTVRGMKHDDVVNETINKDCMVELYFEESDITYKIVRYRKNTSDINYKPNDLVLFVGDEDVSGVSVEDTQQRVNELLGLDFVTFCAMMPGAGVRVASMTDLEVKELLEKLLQTEVLGKAQEITRDLYKQNNTKLQINTDKLKSITDAIVELTNRLNSLQVDHDSFEEVKKNKIEDIKQLLNELETERSANGVVINKAVSVSEKLDKARSRLTDAEKDISTSTKRLYSLTTDHNTKVSFKKAYKDQLNSVEEIGAHCDLCQQSVDKSHIDMISTNILSAIKDIEKEIILLADSVSVEQDKLSKYAAIKELAKKDIDRFLTLQQEAIYAEKTNKSLIKQISRHNEEIEKILKEQNPLENLIEETTGSLTTKQAEQQACETLIDELSQEDKLLAYWLDGFAPSGLRSFMLDHVTPVLNSAAKKYADLLTEGEMAIKFNTKETLKNGKIKDKFNIEVTQAHGGSSYLSNSTGERARANLVIALALGDLAALRVNKRIPFRFLDEPFESVDESGTDAILKLLNNQQDYYDSVFVITHQDHFKQLFDNKVTIVKKNGFSSWEEEDNV
jgi:DNA repair exonuclease SbcCD ATPase subunit